MSALRKDTMPALCMGQVRGWEALGEYMPQSRVRSGTQTRQNGGSHCELT
jgi:hypothetical protein